MIHLSAEGEILFDIRISGTVPALSFGEEVGLRIWDTDLICSIEMPTIGFTVYALSVSDGNILISAEAPDLNLYPAKLSISDSSTIIPTSETPSLTLGPLPKGLTLVDHGDGTAQIYGTPAPGTAGDYYIPLAAANTEGETDRVLWLRIKDG